MTTIFLYNLLNQYLKSKLEIADERKRYPAGFLLWTSCFLYCFSMFVLANAKLDKTEAKSYEVVVRSKFIEHGRRSTAFYVGFDSVIKQNSCCFIEENFDYLRIKEFFYKKVIPNKTKLILMIKPGYLEMPLVTNYNFIFSDGVSNLEKVAAMSWTEQIVNNQGAVYKEEKWPDGKRKSQEAIEGQITDIPKYLFYVHTLNINTFIYF